MKIKLLQNFFDMISGKKRYNNIISSFERSQERIKNSIESSLDYIKNFLISLQSKYDYNYSSISSSLEVINNYLNISSFIDFSTKGKKLFCYGFYEAEDWGCWLTEKSDVVFKGINTESDIQLDITFNVFRQYSEPSLDIYVNNVLLATVLSTNFTNPYKIIVRNKLIRKDKLIKLSFLTKGAVSPSSVSDSSDGRKLGYGIVSITSNLPLIICPISDRDTSFYSYFQCNFNNELWDDYFFSHDVYNKLRDLKKDVENSHLFDLLLKRRLEPYKFYKYEENVRDMILKQDLSKYKILDKNGFQPEVFFFKNGLRFIDVKIVKFYLDGRSVIDGGACTGDSALMFSEFDCVDKVYSFEPIKNSFLNLKNTLELNHCRKAEAVNKGLGGIVGDSVILGETCKIVTIDSFSQNKKIGCIKLDIEGLELETVKGAIETIKKDTPILLICLYHTPYDFFEIKPLLESLNLGYKFKVVNTEPCNSLIGVHLVLVAYKPIC